MEFDFLIEVVSTVDTPIKSQKYLALKTSVIPQTEVLYHNFLLFRQIIHLDIYFEFDQHSEKQGLLQ